MTILITADIHLSANPRDAYRHLFMKRLPKFAQDMRASVIFILGDLTENKDAHPAELVNAVVDHLYALTEVAAVVILEGNHDFLSSPDNPYFAFLRHIEGITWVGKPTPSDKLHKGISALLPPSILCPYTPNHERDWKDINFKNYVYMFAHQTFTNARSEAGFKMEGIPLNYFPKNLQIISGDVHNPQTIGPLTYVGSPFSVDFGDAFEPRVLLLKNDKLTSIPVTGPQKRLIEINSLADLKKQKLGEKDILKVRVNISASQHAEWPELSAAVRKWGADNGYQIHTVQPVIALPVRSTAKVTKAKAAKSDEQHMQDYAQQRGIDERTLKTGLQLLS